MKLHILIYKSDIEYLINNYPLFLLIKVINNNTNKQVECKERSKYNEKYKIEVHVDVDFPDRLFVHLEEEMKL